MKIRYLLNDDQNHYVEYDLDLSAKTLSNKYVKAGVIQTGNSISVAEILNMEPTIHPKIEIAKKGFFWDFHLFKKDAYGKEFRKTLGLFVIDRAQPSKVEFINDGTDDVTLKNYTTHDLEVYSSPLVIRSFDFTDIEGLNGTSGNAETAPVITANDELTLGWDSDVALRLAAGDIQLNEKPMLMYFTIPSFGPNDASNMPQIEWIIGNNTIIFDTSSGVSFNGNQIFSSSQISAGVKVILEINGTSAFLVLNDTKMPLNQFDLSAPIQSVQFKGHCNNNEFSTIGEFIFYTRENYRLDSIAPGMVEDLDIIAGDKELFLTWRSNTEEDLEGYHVYVDGYRNNLDLILTPDYQIAGLQNGVPVKVIVTAVDKSGNESAGHRSIEIHPVSSPDKEVSNVTTWNSDIGVHFEWANPMYTDFRKVKIHRHQWNDSSQMELITLENGENSFVDETNPAPGSYIYYIYTEDVYGNLSQGLMIYKTV